MEQVQGPLGVLMKEKTPSVLNKNSGLYCLQLIRDVHYGINGKLLRIKLLWTL